MDDSYFVSNLSSEQVDFNFVSKHGVDALSSSSGKLHSQDFNVSASQGRKLLFVLL